MATGKKDDGGIAEVQKTVEAEQDRGLRGEEVDQTPNEHYSVSGVTSGKPTPENEEGRESK